MEITALNNDLVKDCVKLQKKKYRDETGLFLLEGYKTVQEAVQSGIELIRVFVLKEKQTKYSFVSKEIIETTPAVLKKLSTTDTAPEVVAVAKQPKQNLNKLQTAKKVVLLENIADVGNLGTIIRSAAAFEIDAVILYGETVDIYNPKCVRSTVGNLWKTDIFHLSALTELERYFNEFEKIATLPKQNNTIMFNDWQPAGKTLVMFGSESEGLSKELIKYSNKGITIEMSKNVESLNLGVSTSIIMHKMRFN